LDGAVGPNAWLFFVFFFVEHLLALFNKETFNFSRFFPF
jgi:hypothetical protein